MALSKLICCFPGMVSRTLSKGSKVHPNLSEGDRSIPRASHLDVAIPVGQFSCTLKFQSFASQTRRSPMADKEAINHSTSPLNFVQLRDVLLWVLYSFFFSGPSAALHFLKISSIEEIRVSHFAHVVFSHCFRMKIHLERLCFSSTCKRRGCLSDSQGSVLDLHESLVNYKKYINRINQKWYDMHLKGEVCQAWCSVLEVWNLRGSSDLHRIIQDAIPKRIWIKKKCHSKSASPSRHWKNMQQEPNGLIISPESGQDRHTHKISLEVARDISYYIVQRFVFCFSGSSAVSPYFMSNVTTRRLLRAIGPCILVARTKWLTSREPVPRQQSSCNQQSCHPTLPSCAQNVIRILGTRTRLMCLNHG